MPKVIVHYMARRCFITACDIDVADDVEDGDTATTRYRYAVTCPQCKNALRGRA